MDTAGVQELRHLLLVPLRSNSVFTALGVVVTWLSANAVAKTLIRSDSIGVWFSNIADAENRPSLAAPTPCWLSSRRIDGRTGRRVEDVNLR
jgi:hypothetical protein